MTGRTIVLLTVALGAVVLGVMSIAAGLDSVGIVLAFLGVIVQQAGAAHALDRTAAASASVAHDTNAIAREIRANGYHDDDAPAPAPATPDTPAPPGMTP